MIFNSKTKLTFLNRGPLGTKGVVKLSFSGSNDGAVFIPHLRASITSSMDLSSKKG